LRHELEIKKEALAKSQSSYKQLRKELRHDVISILQAVDLPDYDEFPLTQEELRNMMVKYGQGHLIHEVKKND